MDSQILLVCGTLDCTEASRAVSIVSFLDRRYVLRSNDFDFFSSFSSLTVSLSSLTAERNSSCRCCSLLVWNVGWWDWSVKAVEVPDRRKSRAHLDRFVILELFCL